MRNLAICFICLAVQVCTASNYVPFLLWTNIKNDQCASDVSIKPGEYITAFPGTKFFQCLKETKPDKIEIFITDELDESDLSLDDIESKTAAFSYLQDALRSPMSVTMPAVQSTSVVPFISATLKKSFADAEFSMVELPTIDRESIGDTKKSISKIDNIIKDEINKFSDSETYIAVLTANSAPQRPRRNGENVHFGRQLLATKDSVGDKNTTVIEGDCIYIAYNNITLKYQATTYELANPNHTNTLCNDTLSKIDITFKVKNGSTVEDKEVKLGLTFDQKQYPVSLDTWWGITSAVLTHSFNNSNSTLYDYRLKIKDKYSYAAPANWSWVCQAPEIMTWRPTKDEAPTQLLEFQFLQLQPFGVTNSSFSRALDCSGFLTGPIFMGIMISLLLAVIFAFGLYALAAITTMDRFDDPRGKTFVVHGHEGN